MANSKEGMTMECLYCRGELVRERISYAATRRGYHLIIDEVPAWVCRQCAGNPFSMRKRWMRFRKCYAASMRA